MEPASIPPLSPRRRARERAGTPPRSRMIRVRVSEEEYAALVERVRQWGACRSCCGTI